MDWSSSALVIFAINQTAVAINIEARMISSAIPQGPSFEL